VRNRNQVFVWDKTRGENGKGKEKQQQIPFLVNTFYYNFSKFKLPKKPIVPVLLHQIIYFKIIRKKRRKSFAILSICHHEFSLTMSCQHNKDQTSRNGTNQLKPPKS